MISKIIFIFSILLLFTSCSSEYDKRMKISTTGWVGYTPLYYIKAKGWLEPLNIRLLSVSSLAENMYIYQAGNSDAFTGTQYEYGVLHQDSKNLVPIMMFDRSNGGDIVMSNFSLKELQETDIQIDAYLELDSINNNVLKDFVKRYHLQKKNINYINRDQVLIKELKATAKPTIIVTYIPYNLSLENQGFRELASTKGTLDLLVVDSMFTKVEFLNEHKKQFIELKKLIDKSVRVLKTNPKGFYETIKPYIEEMDYEEFISSLNDIIWINENISQELNKRMTQANFPIRDLLHYEN